MKGIERFVAAAYRRRLAVHAMVAFLVLSGLWAWQELPVEAFPDLTNNQAVVVTEAPGLSATEVEQQVTYPIETALMGVPRSQEVRSLSKFGLSIVTVVFDDDVPVYFARQLVAERVNDARGRLPEGIEPTLGPVATAFGEIYQYLIEGDVADPMTKKALQDWDVRTRLRAVRGVSEINSWGGQTKEFHVLVDPRKLDRFGLGLRQVVTALGENNATFSGGFIEHRSERFTVRGLGLATGIEDLKRIVVATVDSVPVFVSDVADVTVGEMPRSGAVTRDGKGESVAGMVIMLQGENGKRIALVESITRADAAALFMEEMKLDVLYKKRTPPSFKTDFVDPEKAAARVTNQEVSVPTCGRAVIMSISTSASDRCARSLCRWAEISRSRAVRRPFLCCASMRSCPPPRRDWAFRSRSVLIRV